MGLDAKKRQENAVQYAETFERSDFDVFLSYKLQAAFNKPFNLVLDYGCGTGAMLDLLPRAKEIIGIDISPYMLRRALGKDKEFYAINSDGEWLPFRDNVFDFIVCYDTLHHLTNPLIGLKEIYRVLKKDSEALIIEPLKETKLYKSVQLFYHYLLFVPVKMMKLYRWLKGDTKLRSRDSFHPGHPGYLKLSEYKQEVERINVSYKIRTTKFGFLPDFKILYPLAFPLDSFWDSLFFFRSNGHKMILKIKKL